MDSTRLFVLGLCLLFLQSLVDGRAVEKMMIDDEYSEFLSEVAKAESLTEQDSTDRLSQYDIDLLPDIDDELERESDNVACTTVTQCPAGHWWGNKKIAFSATLSKDKRLGSSQHVKFDHVLLNDGNGYEASTGIFRAPVSGVYSFTFVVAQRHGYEIRVNLIADGKVIAGAVAEGSKTRHDVQGTNSVNIHVCKGKPVWVQAYAHGRLEGSKDNFKYTSFSGHLLYERK